MESPISQPRRSGTPREQAEEYMRDYIYGVATYNWYYTLTVNNTEHFPLWMFPREYDLTPEQQAFKDKWGENTPTVSLLYGFGYIIEEVVPPTPTGQPNPIHARPNTRYSLTTKAFDLLDKPSRRIRVFISYKRSESSAFALLLEARLRMVGVREDSVFVDKVIQGGELWQQRLEREIATCDYFVSLIAPTTLESEWIGEEIEQARHRADVPIIPVCHNGMRLADIPTHLGIHHGYEIDKEDALNYEAGVSFVLNALGYKTY
jgi:hypothetical protein